MNQDIYEIKGFFDEPKETGIRGLVDTLENISNSKLSPKDIDRYKKGITAYVFNYQGFLQYHLRYDIDNVSSNCEFHSVKCIVFKTNERYFTDIHNAVFLKDKYAGLFIQGIFPVREYLSLLDNSLFQKHNMIPLMKRYDKQNAITGLWVE
jgi:hypothetical protein